MNLYAYVNGNPVNAIDPYGLWSITDPTTWSPIPQPVVDWSACFGDTISLGLTKWIRSKNDTNKYVDFCSDPCSYGKYSGFALDLFMGGKALWAKAARNRAVPRVAQRFCFVAGTLVRTPDGLKPIEDIQVGDRVESRDEVTNETTWKPVLQLIRNTGKSTLNIILVDDDGNSDKIGVTPEHPFRVEGKGWVPAGELKAGDKVIGATDKLLTIKSSVRDKERHDTYNFEVADYHTYFVGTLGAWVHNACKPINLPSWKKIKIDIDHIASGHMKGGSRVSPSKDLFPENMTKSQVEKTVREAYRNGQRVETQGDRVRVQGNNIEMWVNTRTNTIETAYPIK
jgi:Pretoxin HINT domain/Bacterial EndoU nuclease